jgi:hypothetical protein
MGLAFTLSTLINEEVFHLQQKVSVIYVWEDQHEVST